MQHYVLFEIACFIKSNQNTKVCLIGLGRPRQLLCVCYTRKPKKGGNRGKQQTANASFVFFTAIFPNMALKDCVFTLISCFIKSLRLTTHVVEFIYVVARAFLARDDAFLCIVAPVADNVAYII